MPVGSTTRGGSTTAEATEPVVCTSGGAGSCRMESTAGLWVGQHGRVERDEEQWPSKGTWPRYRGRTGWVASVNRRDGEVGVSWSRQEDIARMSAEAWFVPHELTVIP